MQQQDAVRGRASRANACTWTHSLQAFDATLHAVPLLTFHHARRTTIHTATDRIRNQTTSTIPRFRGATHEGIPFL